MYWVNLVIAPRKVSFESQGTLEAIKDIPRNLLATILYDTLPPKAS